MGENFAPQAKARLRSALARQLHTAAQLVTSRDRLFLARAYPPASVPGEYAHRRTGGLLASSDHYPQSVEELSRTQSVAFFRAAFYDKYLVGRGRLSVQDTVERLRPQLAAMFGGGVTVG